MYVFNIDFVGRLSCTTSTEVLVFTHGTKNPGVFRNQELSFINDSIIFACPGMITGHSLERIIIGTLTSPNKTETGPGPYRCTPVEHRISLLHLDYKINTYLWDRSMSFLTFVEYISEHYVLLLFLLSILFTLFTSVFFYFRHVFQIYLELYISEFGHDLNEGIPCEYPYIMKTSWFTYV